MYWRKVPWLIRRLFSKITWRLPNNEKKIYLTFDDGPTEEFTEEILRILQEKGVKASFFCLGKNIDNQPYLFEKIKDAGHFVGNHGYKHIDGWKVSKSDFLDNIIKAEKFYDNNFFRPPYGKFKLSLLSQLSRKYSVIMWDILCGDFDPKYSETECLIYTLKNTKEGSIIVMHDNIKSGDKMIAILPEIIDGLRNKSFHFERL